VTVTTPMLQLRDGAQMATTAFAQGDAGSIVVNASESVQVSGGFTVNDSTISSGLRTDTLGEGDGGDITINTPVLVMDDSMLNRLAEEAATSS